VCKGDMVWYIDDDEEEVAERDKVKVKEEE
jgi:hypothetical protein